MNAENRFDKHHSFFYRHLNALKLAIAIWVVGGIGFHLMFEDFIWPIAAVLCTLMVWVYPIEALMARRFLKLECFVALILTSLAMLSLFYSPYFVIAAIFLHGVWDLFKHNGFGIPFFRWYTVGCVLYDWAYALALLAYLAWS